MNLLTRMRVRQAVLSDLSIRKYIFNRNQVFKLQYIPFNIKAFVLTKKAYSYKCLAFNAVSVCFF